MTALPKVARIARAVERAEAHKALTERAATLAARPVQAKPSPAIPNYTHAAIAATVSSPAPVAMSPTPATTAPAPAVRPAIATLNDWRAARHAALSSVEQWRPGEKFPVGGRVNGGRWVVLARDASGGVADYGFLPD